jgi:hypothetical protein
MNEELKKLYDAIVSKGFYTKSYDDFVNQYQDPAYRDKVFDVVTSEGLYTKGREEFDAKYAATGLKKKETSVSTSQEAAMEQPMATGSSELPKSAGVSVTTPTGQQATVEWGPTEFKASQDAPMYDMASLSDIVGNVDVTIDEATKQKISNVVGITGAVFNKIVNPQSNAAQALADAKKFADNTQTAYNVGALSAQISNNMADEVPDYERIAKLKQQLKNEQPKLLSSQLGAEAGDFFDMLAANPVTFLTEVLTTSATQMTGGAGAMTPEDLLYATALGLPTAGAGATAYMSGKNSLNAEMSSRILDALEERGVDVTNAEQLRAAMTNPELMMDVKSEVQAPALIVGALDAISGGLAGRFGKPLVELAIQAGAGAVGEAGAQIAADGRITAPSAILTEMVAELPGGLIETAFGAKTKDIARKSKVNQEIKEIESELAATEDPEVRSVLETALNAKRDEKNKIFTDYADFVNSLPEEEVARLNALNEEIVKVSNAINTVTSDIAGKALRDRRQSLLDEVAKIEETATPTQDAVQEQATDEGVLRPEQPEVGLQEVVEGDQEPQVAAEEVVQEEVGTIGTLLNERVSYSDPVSGETVEGDLFVDGQRVVLEAAGGQQFDLGNVDEVLGLNIEEAALVAPAEMAIIPQEDGSFVFNKEGNQKVAKGTTMFNRQPGLQAIRRDAEGKVDRVTLYSEDGAETYNLTGQEAEDAAYYIVRGFVETQEGQDAINQLAQRNEEARRDLSQPLGTRAVQQAAPQAPAPVRVEAPAGPAVEEQIADIERRRQEDLNQFVVSDVKTEKYNVPIFLDSNAKVRGDKQEYISREVFDKAYANDNREGAGFQTAETLIRRGGYTKGELLSGPQALLKPEIDKINAKYDAELAALKQANAAPSVEAGPAVEAAVEDDIQAQEVADLAAEMQAAAPTTVERLNRVAERARKAISKVIPDVKIIVHDTDAAYREASGDTEQGTYIPATKTIHINASKATPGAVAHEVFHAVFLDRVKTDVAAQRAAKKMVESLKRVVGEGSELYQYLDAFSQNYDANFQNEEKLAELAAVLAENYMGLETSGLSKGAIASFKQAVKDFINAIAKRFGIQMPSTLTDADVMGILNAIAQKTVTGEIITEADVAAIDVLAEPGTVVLETNISPAIRQRRGLINVTEREAIKYAKIGINDQRVMQAMEDIGLAGVKFTKGDVETAIAKAFNEAIDDINSSNIYKGESVVITQDSPGITRAIEAEIATLEEQGAPARIIDDAKRTLDSQSGRNQYIQEYQSAQLQTLNQWTSYLSQSDYDPAFKLVMLDAVVTNNYDSNTKKYIKRDSKTIRNITPFDAGTLAQLYGMTDSKELLKTYVEIQADNAENIVKANEMKSTKDGKWLKFNGGSETPSEERAANATALSQLVQDTPWCTKTNASSQLDGGDFYVYATKATDGRYIPRVAVRMEDDRVGELRGVASSKQDLEPEMLPVAEKFLREEIPNDSGKKWLDSVEYNKRIKAYIEELRGRKVAMDDFNKYAEIKADEKRYSVDYGTNGFVERLNAVMRDKVMDNDLSPDLVGRVELNPTRVNANTKVLFAGVTNFVDHNMSDFVGLEMIVGNAEWNYEIENFPPKLKTVTGNVEIYNEAESIGNIEFVGQTLLLSSDRIKTLGNLKHAGAIDIRRASVNSLEDLGDLEEINIRYEGEFYVPEKITSLGKIKRVNGSISLSRSAKLESFGNLEYVSKSMQINDSERINSLGKIKTIGEDLVIRYQNSITSLDNVEYVGGVLDIEQSNIKDIPNLKYIGGMASFPYGVKSIAGISFFGRHVIYYNGTKGPSVNKINGDLLLSAGKKNELTDLGEVEEVTGNLTVYDTSSLGNIRIVGGKVDIFGRKKDDKNIKSIENLEYVGGDFYVTSASRINSFGSLKHIGGGINAQGITEIGQLRYVGERFLNRFRIPMYKEMSAITRPTPASFAERYVRESLLNEKVEGDIFNLVVESVSNYFGVDMPPKLRQRKGSPAFENWSATPKSSAQKIGHMYNMNHKGFAPKTIDPMHFKRDVERIDDRLSVRKTALGTGYHMTLNGKFFNPYERVIEGRDGGPNGVRQRVNSQTTNIFDIVETARAKGYTDKTIELYLKQEGFDATEIKNALAVASGLNGAEVPEAFGYVEGGMAIGQSLFSEIQENLNKMTEDGADKTDIRIEAQRLLMDSDIYKAQTQDVQAQLRLSLDASIGSNVADRAFRQEFKELRAMLASKKRMARELNAIKSKMRGFIRKNLPQGEYSKAEVVKLLKAIVDANVDSLPLVMQQVQNYVTEFKVRNLESQIKKLLATKTTKVDSGRVMGITTIGVQEDLATLNDMLIDDGMSEDNKQDLFSKQVNEYQTLNSKYDLTDEDIRRLQLLEIANAYNGAMLLDDNNPVKVESLTMARDRINIMITVGRSEFNANQKIKHQQQKKNVVDVLEAITGNPVPEDITDDDKLDGYVRNEKTTDANIEALKSRISKVLGAFAKNPLKAYFNRGASLSNLLGQITANLTDMFGGPVNEMVYDKIKQSDIELARRELVVGKMIESKLKEIYGKDYNISVKQNKIPRIIDVFKKERAVEARRLMEEMKTASPGRKSEIMLELTEMRVFDPLSQNKIYYLYNQFKSQENRAGLETNYGENYVEYLNELFENHLDPKVREWADWQVDVLFPELYDAYNPVYVEIFKTNMPWTSNYAGRVYRKGDSQTDMAIPLMDQNGKFATIQTPSSTKARKQNKNGIQEMDGDLVLDSYIKDMEYFRAYGVNIRDISRIFKNEAVRIAVKKTAGEDVLDLIDGYIKIVGTNGMSVGTTMKQSILDTIDSKLGASYMAGSLNQLIKQTTSAFLFAPRVGINNWIAYTAKAAPNLGTVWNEFIDNAPRIVKRYNPKEMASIMGGYDSKLSRKIAEEAGVGNNRKALKALDKTSQALNALMWPVIQGDKYSAMVGAMGNYLYYKDMYMGKNPGATNEQAIKFAADKVSTEIEQILGSSSRIDRDSFQNSGNALFRALSFLSNSPKAMIRNIIPAYSGLFKKIASFDRTAGQGTLKQNLETILMFQVFVPLLFRWAAIGMPGLWRSWRDDDDEELGAAAILGPFEALLIVGPLLTLAKDRILDKPWADDMPTIPIYDLTEDLVRQVNKIIKAQTSDSLSNSEADELREDALLNISYIIAGGFGIPAKNIDRMIRNIGELGESDGPGEALLRLFNYSDYTIEGPDKKKK